MTPLLDIQLVPACTDYAKAFFQWRTEPHTLQYNPVRDLSLREVRYNLSKTATNLDSLEESVSYRWFIMLDKQLVGTVSLGEINLTMKFGEIGYMIGEAFYGKGIATAAVKKWSEFIFEKTNLRKLIAFVAESNAPSIRVLEKVGFQKEGLLRDHYLINEKPVSQVIFGLLRADLKSWD